MSATLAGWRNGSKARRCNRFPTVWAAIYGCKGERTTAWRYTVGNFGHRVAEYACPTCQAADAATAQLVGPARQDALEAAQRAAGVEDYRSQRVSRINGVPTLIGVSL